MCIRDRLRTLIAPNVATDIQDPWYETNIRLRPGRYSRQDTETTGLDQMHLPDANPFVPENFELISAANQTIPQALIDEANRSLWYYADTDFKQPKAHVRVLLEQYDIQNSARERVLARLYSRTVNEALNTYSYPAYLAGLSYNLSTTGQGLLLHIGGYQDKLPELLSRILTEMQTIELDDDAFVRYKNSLQRALENQLKGKPYHRTLEELKHWLYEPSFNQQQLLAELASVERQDVLTFAENFHKKLAQEIYIHGNLNEQQAHDMAAMVNQYFPANNQQLSPAELLQAPIGLFQQQLQLDHQDNAFTLYIQGSDSSDRSRASFSLLGQILSAPYYQYMRTEQQLGYIVFATPYPQQTVPALAFIVQSPETAPQQLLQHSETFFKQYEEKLSALTPDEFASFKQGLVNLLLEKPKNLAEKASRFWRELNQHRYQFNTMESIAKEVETLTLDEITTLYKKAISEKQHPWLMMVQGGELQDVAQLSEIERNELARFTLPTAVKKSAADKN